MVRRLTLVETSRLQAFPDVWNTHGVNETGELFPQSDSARYRQLGNAVTVNVAEWIARRLAATITPLKEIPHE
jgi:DNA (cytosine-5)-methyltransferase 1